MHTINYARVIVGGLLAGLLINISETLLNAVVLARQMEAAVQSMNLPPIGGQAIAGFVVFGFVLASGASGSTRRFGRASAPDPARPRAPGPRSGSSRICTRQPAWR